MSSEWGARGWSALLTLALGCLPADDRPEPGSLYLTAEAGSALSEGVASDDGWTITFERFVTALGDVRLRDYPERSGSCHDYAETYYEWLFDFTKVSQPEKVGIVFGLGTCGLEFRLRSPSDETVLGVGASEAMLRSMLRSGSDLHQVEDERASLVVKGQAEREGITKRFGWVFRRDYELEECPAEVGEGFVNVVELRGEEALTRSVVVRAEELFRASPDDSAPLSFTPFAEADLDADGTITLEELASSPLGSDNEGPWLDEIEPEAMPANRLALIYEHLLPRVARMVGGGACEAEPRERY